MLQWSEKYSIGVKIIDEQHKQFFATFNKLYDAFLSGEAVGKMAEFLKELNDYANYHFATEEKYFKDFNFEGMREHIDQHDIFRNQIAEFRKHFDKTVDRKQLVSELVELLDDWLAHHLVELDQKYVECFKKHGLR